MTLNLKFPCMKKSDEIIVFPLNVYKQRIIREKNANFVLLLSSIITKIKAIYCFFFHTMYHLGNDNIRLYKMGFEVKRITKQYNGMEHSAYFEVGNLGIFHNGLLIFCTDFYDEHKDHQIKLCKSLKFPYSSAHTINSHRLSLFYMSIPILFYSIIFDISNHYKLL